MTLDMNALDTYITEIEMIHNITLISISLYHQHYAKAIIISPVLLLQIYTSQDNLTAEATTYNTNSDVLKANHPLKIAVSNKHLFLFLTIYLLGTRTASYSALRKNSEYFRCRLI